MDGEFHMLNWQLWEGTAEAWDQLLERFSDYSVYQSYAWGEHRARFNWRPLRLVLRKEDNISAMVQILIRNYPLNLGLVWIPGGPLGDIDFWDASLQRAIMVGAGVRFLYCRINSMRRHSAEEELKLTVRGWRKSAYPLNSGLSLAYKPMQNEDVRLKQSSSNWRHNFRRSAKRGLSVYLWKNPDPKEMMLAYISMQEYKQLKDQTNLEQIDSIVKAFKERCLLVRCDDENGNLLAFRGALVQGEKAWDIFAATTPVGRNMYASHAAFWELMKQCAVRNINWYDMSGVDPVKNRGVYDFKKGTGAQDLQYLGEWEYAKPSIFGILVSRVIVLKGLS